MITQDVHEISPFDDDIFKINSKHVPNISISQEKFISPRPNPQSEPLMIQEAYDFKLGVFF